MKEEEFPIHDAEKENLTELVDALEGLRQEGDVVMGKLIEYLRSGNVEQAKYFCRNQADKFTPYSEDGVPLIIEKLYGETGSPWAYTERKMREGK